MFSDIMFECDSKTSPIPSSNQHILRGKMRVGLRQIEELHVLKIAIETLNAFEIENNRFL
jgi:hypothetical protein